MTLALYNTLSRKKEPFEPAAKTVRMYVCGPTVYEAAHIGNLRTYVFEDILRRWLRRGQGYRVKQVMNITDIEDKIIAGAKAKTLDDVRAFTKPHEQRFFADLRTLGIEQAESYPKATEYVPQMIALIERILEAGFAYEREGSVYFDVRRYNDSHGYGALQKIDLSGFNSQARIDNDEYDKETAQDFALWKAEPVGAPGWTSPWGHGRPGWHIECSAMAEAELGGTLPIDIHAGAVDLTFPHHENEVAQTKAATGKDLARFFVHGEHLLIDGAKMAKSEGNVVTLEDVAAKGYQPVHLRILFLQAHYRSKLNFTWKSLAAAKESHGRVQAFYDRLATAPVPAAEDPAAVAKLIAEARERFDRAMDDDLNTAEALAAVFDFVRDGNALIDQGELDDADLGAVLGALKEWNAVLGVFMLQAGRPPAAVTKLAAERQASRERGEYQAADELRQRIEAKGWLVEDTSDGPRLRKR